MIRIPEHNKGPHKECTHQRKKKHDHNTEHKQRETEYQDEFLKYRMIHFEMIMCGFPEPLYFYFFKVLFREVLNMLASVTLTVGLWSEEEG